MFKDMAKPNIESTHELRPGEPGFGLPPAEHTYRMPDMSLVQVSDGGADVVYGAISDETELPATFQNAPRSNVPRYEPNIGRAEAMAHAADPHMSELQEAKDQLAILQEKSTPSGGRLRRFGQAMLGGIPKVDPDVPVEYYDSPLRVGRLQRAVDEAERGAALVYDNRPERLVRDDDTLGPFYMEPGEMQSVRLRPDLDASGYRVASVETRPNPHMSDRDTRL